MFRLSDDLVFPHPLRADRDGLLAWGGDLSPERLLLAYRHGIFPWYSEGEPILWWAPNPRWVIVPEGVKVSKSMNKLLERKVFECSMDTDFDAVIEACASVPRPGQDGTWLMPEMLAAYKELHRRGLAHSVEVRRQGVLVGGLYGLSLGRVFYGESMFARVSNASKYALVVLARELHRRGFWLIDCQVHTEHLESMGAQALPAAEFHALLEKNPLEQTLRGAWTHWLEEN